MKTKTKHHENNGQDKSFLTIDLTRLEWEFARQGDLYKSWADKLAKARREVDIIERKIKVVEAKLRLDMAKSPEKYDLEKTTKDVLDAAITIYPSVDEANNELIEAKYRVGILSGTVESLQQKKKGIEKECDLWAFSYFSIPKLSGDDDTRDSMREATKRATRQKLATRKRD